MVARPRTGRDRTGSVQSTDVRHRPSTNVAASGCNVCIFVLENVYKDLYRKRLSFYNKRKFIMCHD